MHSNPRFNFNWFEPVLIISVYLSIIIWSFLDSGDYLFSYPFNVKDGSIYWALLIGGIANAFLFGFTVYFLIPKFLSNQKYLLFICLLAVAFMAATAFELILEGWMKTSYDLPNSIQASYNLNYQTPIRDIGGPAWVINLVVIFFAFIYRFTRDWMLHEKHKRLLLEAQLGTELKLLKSQINPHFLFNTLNNIYSITRKNNDEEAALAIGKLSSILRYMLSESNSDRIPLRKEVEYIHSLIEIQHLRLEKDELVVNFETAGDIENMTIAPMVLIPFVENAFKYGVEIGTTSVVNIRIAVKDSAVKFTITNAKRSEGSSSGIESAGIGLANVQRRLNLIYGDNHTLQILDEGENFQVKLMIIKEDA